jgi:hypothetical protein
VVSGSPEATPSVKGSAARGVVVVVASVVGGASVVAGALVGGASVASGDVVAAALVPGTSVDGGVVAGALDAGGPASSPELLERHPTRTVAPRARNVRRDTAHMAPECRTPSAAPARTARGAARTRRTIGADE